MKSTLVVLLLAACSGHATLSGGADASGDDDGMRPDAPAAFPQAIMPGDFPHALDKPFIEGLQTWIDAATFEVKFTASLDTPIGFLGSADSAFHADLASRTMPAPARR